MTRPMNRAIVVFGALSEGKYDNVIEANGSDETAQVLRQRIQLRRRQVGERRHAGRRISTPQIIAQLVQRLFRDAPVRIESRTLGAAARIFTMTAGAARGERRLPGQLCNR